MRKRGKGRCRRRKGNRRKRISSFRPIYFYFYFYDYVPIFLFDPEQNTFVLFGHCQTAIGWTSLGLSYTGVDFYNLKDLKSNRMTIESGFYRVLFLYHYTHVHHWVGEALHRELGLLVHLTLKAY